MLSIIRQQVDSSRAAGDSLGAVRRQVTLEAHRRRFAGDDRLKNELFVNYVLAAERLDMTNAVEVRLPFLDHKLFDYASSIPVSMLAKDGTIKYILREAVKDYITDEVYRGLKQPFLAPPTTKRNDDAMFVMLQDILRSASFASVPFFDRAAVIKLLDDISTMDETARASMDPVLFMMASIGVLHEQYGL